METKKINGYLHQIGEGSSVSSDQGVSGGEITAEEYLSSQGFLPDEIRKIIIGSE